jgi:hypothetical protein
MPWQTFVCARPIATGVERDAGDLADDGLIGFVLVALVGSGIIPIGRL